MTALPLRALISSAFGLILSMTVASADNAPFLGTDPAAVAAKGEIDIQQWLSWSSGHAGESFNGFTSQTEFDYGVTDRLQLALTLVYDWSRTRPPGGPATSESLPGLAAEAIYVVMPIDTNPIGVALAIDPAFNSQSRGVAFRLLLTRYFAGFENVLNLNFEDDWDKDDTGHWKASSEMTFNYGIAHALDNHWTVAIEFGNEFAFDQLLTDGRFHHEATTFFIGPTVQYECERITATLGFQTQLPWSSGTNVVNGYVADVERFRLGLRLNRAV